MFCPKCGEKVNRNTNFCLYCGFEITRIEPMMNDINEDIEIFADAINATTKTQFYTPTTPVQHLGMKWFKFFTKIRPWILIAFGVLIGYILTLPGTADAPITLLDVLLYIGFMMIQLIVFLRSNERTYNYLKLIRFSLIYEVVYYVIGYSISQIILGTDIASFFMLTLLYFVLEYFFWYKYNMKYFKKRLPIEDQE